MQTARKESVIRSVLFSVADRQMEGFLERRAFEESLVQSVLFHPHILVPDIFFFISNWLYDHVNAPGISLFEEAFKSGIVIPSFRGTDTVTFGGALSVIEDQGILGLIGSEQNRHLAGRLDELLDQEPARCTYWPSDRMLADTYENRIWRILANDSAPIPDGVLSAEVHDKVERLWTIGEPWRNDALQDAIRRSPGGLRRGALMTAIGRTVGISGPINDVQQIFPAAAQQGRSSDEVLAIKGICRVMNDCYLHNLAAEHGNDNSYPSLDPWALLVLGSLRSSSPGSERVEPAPIIEHAVRLPSTKMLLRMKPSTIIASRNELYPDYSVALKVWQKAPNGATENRLRECLDGYAERLVSEYRSQIGGVNSLTETVTATAGAVGLAGTILTLQPEQIGSILGLVGAATTSLIGLGGTGFVIYRWMTRPRTTEAAIRLRANPPMLTAPAE